MGKFGTVAHVPERGTRTDDGDQDEKGEQEAEAGFHRGAWTAEFPVFPAPGKGGFQAFFLGQADG